jgi:hypothetical protein
VIGEPDIELKERLIEECKSIAVNQLRERRMLCVVGRSWEVGRKKCERKKDAMKFVLWVARTIIRG